MKKAMIIILAVIIFMGGIALAGQQKRIQVFDNYKWSGQSGRIDAESECRGHCFSADNVDRYFKEGWQIVTQRPITSQVENIRNIGYCQCFGVEYILESGN